MEKLFGSRTRTRLLVALALLEESYVSELARILDTQRFSVQQMVESLEDDGVLATRMIGNVRRVALDPRFYGFSEFKDLLLKLGLAMPDLDKAISSIRRRPRKRGKPL